MTSPAGTTSLFAVVTLPTTRPAPVIADSAAPCDWPTTFGTKTASTTAHRAFVHCNVQMRAS